MKGVCEPSQSWSIIKKAFYLAPQKNPKVWHKQLAWEKNNFWCARSAVGKYFLPSSKLNIPGYWLKKGTKWPCYFLHSEPPEFFRKCKLKVLMGWLVSPHCIRKYRSNCCWFPKIVPLPSHASIFTPKLQYPFPYNITQHPPPSPFSNVSRAALVAASNTSSTPSPVNDEHSRYFRAPISWAISLASLVPTKCCDRFRISSIATGSSRKSFFRPTSMMGTPGHRSFASSTHLEKVSMWTKTGVSNSNLLCAWRYPRSPVYRLKILLELRVLLNMPTAVISRNLPVPPYPREPIVRSFHPLYNRSRSFRRQLVPKSNGISIAIGLQGGENQHNARENN